MISNLIKTVCRIHAVDWEGRELEFLRDRGRGRTLIERDMSFYWDMLKYAQPDAEERFAPVWKWLVENQPLIENPVLNHGDCNPGNYMFRGVDVVGVFDWEMCCLAAPEVDLAYLCSNNEFFTLGLDEIPGVPWQEDLLAEYESLSGHKIQNFEYYRTMMLYRIATISLGFTRKLPEAQRAATRAALGWFEDNLMERIKGLSR